MKNAKKLLAIILAVLTFVSVASISVYAESYIPVGGSTEIYAALAKIEFVSNSGLTRSVESGKIKITASESTDVIKIKKTDAVEIVCANTEIIDGTEVSKNDKGEVISTTNQYTLAYKDVHKAKAGESKVPSSVETIITVDGKTYGLILAFKGENADGHRYTIPVGEAVDPTIEEAGYTLHLCVCGAVAKKVNGDKLPGKVVNFDCGPDFTVAKKGTIKIEPVVTLKGDAEYKVEYKTIDAEVATVDEKGVVTGVKVGRTTVVATLTYTENGKTVTLEDTVNVKVNYSLIQWLLIAFEAVSTGSVFIWDLILDALGFMK